MIPAAWLGRVPYGLALEMQRVRRDAVVDGAAPEVLWLLEHDPVYTTGRRGVDLDPDALGAPLHRTERGGLTTWHGPGQLVGYVIADVARRGGSVKGVVAAVEDGIIGWLRGQGVGADRRAGYPGVWVGADKICAVGMHFRRGVSMHGFALNLAPDLGWFDRIVPCGITDGGVTSVARIRGSSPAPADAWAAVGDFVRDSLAAHLTAGDGGLRGGGPASPTGTAGDTGM